MLDELKTYLSYLDNKGIKTLPNDLEYLTKKEINHKNKTFQKPITAKNIKPVVKPVMMNKKATKTAIEKKTYIDYDAIKIDFSKYQNYKTIEELSSHLDKCNKCSLHKLRQNVVMGEGNPNADLMFIGEAPGEKEDKEGRPFIGRAGNLLTKIIEAMHLSRDKIYIANIVKCRPPGNRNPIPDEVDICLPYLLEQISLIKPKIMVLLGAVALKSLFKNKNLSITLLRGKYLNWNGIKVMPTLHPARLLRNPADKKYVWADMQKIMLDLGIKP